MKLSKMFLTKKVFTLLVLLFFSIAVFSQSATIDLTGHQPNVITWPGTSQFEWHSTATPNSLDKLSGTAITAATTSTNYGVFFDVLSSCYSPAAKVDVVISPCGASVVSLATYATAINVLEWYTDSTHSGTKVPDATTVSGGTYFAFDVNGTVFTPINEVVIVSINPVPSAPAFTITQPTCANATGTVTITGVLGETYSLNSGAYSATLIYSGLAASSSNTIYAKNSEGCISLVATASLDAQPATPSAPAYTIIQPTCATATGTVTITGVLGETYSLNSGAYSATLIYSGLAASSSNTIYAKNSAGCISLVATASLDAQPATLENPVKLTTTFQFKLTTISGAN